MNTPGGGATEFKGNGAAELTLVVRGMTCGACARQVEAAVGRLSGVSGAEVALARGTVLVRYDESRVQPADVSDAIRQAGYDAYSSDKPAGATSVGPSTPAEPALPVLPLAAGAAATTLLAAFYLAVVTIAQGWGHALELIGSDWYFVAAIAVGFGVQVGLFVHLRRRRHEQRAGLPTMATGVGTGTSTLAMLACCAHHGGELLVLFGLSAAAVFLNENRVPFMLLGIAANIAGIVIMLRLLRQSAGSPTRRA